MTSKLWQGATEFVLDAAKNPLIQHAALHLGGIPFIALKDPQVQGTLYVMGGVGEIAVGVLLAVLTIETGIGFYGGLLLAGHGIDQIIKGSHQILTNQKQRSITTAVLEEFRVPSEWAENIDDLVGAGGGLIAGSRLLMKVGDDLLEVTVKELGKEGAGNALKGVRGEVKLVDKSDVKPHGEGGDFYKQGATATKVEINIVKVGTEAGDGYKHWFDIDANLLKKEIHFEDDLNHSKLRKKFHSHGEDFGMKGMNFNKENAEIFKQNIRRHINDPDTISIAGTFTTGGVGNVVHYYNPKTKINVMKDMNGKFISGWELNKDQREFLKLKGQIGGQRK